MDVKSVDIEILESTPEYVKAKLPFLNIPVKMNHYFLNSRLEQGYFNILNGGKQVGSKKKKQSKSPYA